MSRIDPHSYADDAQPRTKHVDLSWRVDFEARRIEGTATLTLDRDCGGPLDLDTRGLEILGAEAAGKALPLARGEGDAILGRRLGLDLPAGANSVAVRYRTSREASALQWLEPAQTAGRQAPLLFSQCQAIHARSVAPLQDTPAFRVTYRAEVTVPADLTAVMSAGPAGERPGPSAGTRTFLFEMPQAIPPYLLALAVGRLVSRDLSPRSRVWAEPETVEAAAWEFAGIEEMIVAAERLFGPYEWDRYDMLVLPPSFPYGGMENPRMTFLTPTLLAGDRSLVDVVAHELAHSWTGNLITNANAEHFWLNEGWTVYAERRIIEALHGPEAAAAAWAIGQKALDGSLARLTAEPHLTLLRQHLSGIDPDDAFSSVPYEKGSRFLAALERQVGRPRWDRFIAAYLAKYRFTSITTEEFVAFLDGELPDAAAAVGAPAWLDAPGIPANAPVFRSARLEALTSLAAAWKEGRRPTAAEAKGWNPTELLVYLQNLPRPLDIASCGELESGLSLTGRGNHEILVEWLSIAAASDFEPAFPKIREVLSRVGRMKYLRPLYGALGASARTRALAREIFASASPGYHALSRRVVASEMEKYREEA